VQASTIARAPALEITFCSRTIACADAWGAARIIETPGWGNLNLNRSVTHEE
jgi:hypothetical protein